MFPRSKRLPKKGFVEPRMARVTTANLTATLPHTSNGYAVVVSKKVEKSSVGRHKLKRRISALLEQQKLPNALIVYPKSSVKALSTKELKQEIENLLRQINK